MSLKVRVKGQGQQGQKLHLSALSAASVRFIVGKTSLASSFFYVTLFSLKYKTCFNVLIPKTICFFIFF